MRPPDELARVLTGALGPGHEAPDQLEVGVPEDAFEAHRPRVAGSPVHDPGTALPTLTHACPLSALRAGPLGPRSLLAGIPGSPRSLMLARSRRPSARRAAQAPLATRRDTRLPTLTHARRGCRGHRCSGIRCTGWAGTPGVGEVGNTWIAVDLSKNVIGFFGQSPAL